MIDSEKVIALMKERNDPIYRILGGGRDSIVEHISHAAECVEEPDDIEAKIIDFYNRIVGTKSYIEALLVVREMRDYNKELSDLFEGQSLYS